MTSAAEFQAKVTKAEVNFGRLDGIVNGGPDTVVTTDNGDVPSLAKVIGDLGDVAGAVESVAADLAAAETARTSAEAWAQSPGAPDTADSTSKSAKTLAGEAANSAASVAAATAAITKNAVNVSVALAADQSTPPTVPSTTTGILNPTVGVASTAFRKAVIFNGIAFPADQIVRKFSTKFATPLAGRTVQFALLNSAGVCKWISPLGDASLAATISYNLPDYLFTEAGDMPAIWNSAANSPDGIIARDNQGNSAIGQILANQTPGLPQFAVGSTYTGSTSGYASQTRYLPSIEVITSPKSVLVATSWAGTPNGWLQLDSNARSPMTAMPIALARSSLYPTGAAPIVVGRVDVAAPLTEIGIGGSACTCTSDSLASLPVGSKLVRARGRMIGALANRHAAFWLTDATGKVTWTSGSIDASAAGVISWSATFENAPSATVGGGFGWSGDANPTGVPSAGMGYAYNAGAAISGNTTLYHSNPNAGDVTFPVVGSVVSTANGWTSYNDRQPLLEATFMKPDGGLVTVGYINQPLGVAGLNSDGKISADMVEGAAGDSQLAMALVTLPTPAAAQGSQSSQNVLVLGNSIDAGGQASGEGSDAHYGVFQQLRDYFGWTLNNNAIPGSGIDSWASNLNGVKTNSLALTGITKVIIGFGENDASRATGTPTDLYNGTTGDTFCGRLNQLINDVRSAWPTAEIVLRSNLSPWPVYSGDAWHGPKQWLTFEQQDAMRKQIAVNGGWQYIDARRFLPSYWWNFLIDGLHPGDLGHQLLAAILIMFFGGL